MRKNWKEILMDSILTMITIDADDNYEKNKGRKNMISRNRKPRNRIAY